MEKNGRKEPISKESAVLVKDLARGKNSEKKA